MEKRKEREAGSYDKFTDKFNLWNYHNINRKNNLIHKNMSDYHEEQKKLDKLQSLFLHEHNKEMAHLQQYRRDQFKCKKGTEAQEKANR